MAMDRDRLETINMALLVVGSIAFDSIKTPETEVQDTLGGSSVYFSLAASFFTPVRLVGVVGGDFPRENIRLLESRGVDTAGLEIIEDGKTFRWSGEYHDDMNRRDTLSVELNVFDDFAPTLPDDYRDSAFVFLANASPVTQRKVLEQIESPRFVMADTMDLWIQTQRADLIDLLKRLDGLVINDEEATMLTDQRNVVLAGKEIIEMGPEHVVIKKGEHGALLFTRGGVVPLPAYPMREVRDPTGAGDSFAGALMGRLAQLDSVDEKALKSSLAFGVVVSSFCVEDLGVRRLAEARKDEIERRYAEYRELLTIEA